MKLTKSSVLADIDSLGKNRRTADIDRLISRYVKMCADTSDLREHILSEQRLHRIYFYVPLNQMKDPLSRMEFIHKNLLFSDWWHTDQLIKFVSDLGFDIAFDYAKKYVKDKDPFIRRWGYVLFISKLCREKKNLGKILSLLKNDEHYYVAMAEAWLICELAIFFPEEMLFWFKNQNRLYYNINSKAIQKICDSYRVSEDLKESFKALRPMLKNTEEKA